MSDNKIRLGFFSFTEITDPNEHHSYNEWHQLDHMPEQFPLSGIVYGQRRGTPALVFGVSPSRHARASPAHARGRARDRHRRVPRDHARPVGAHRVVTTTEISYGKAHVAFYRLGGRDVPPLAASIDIDVSIPRK